jgi:hypothetical protein
MQDVRWLEKASPREMQGIVKYRSHCLSDRASGEKTKWMGLTNGSLGEDE